MPGIVCAIRGGPDSQPTIDKAISFAGEKKLQLHFLYVVNLNFLTHTESSRTHFVYDEMDQLGEFILLTAQEKAKSQNITAEGVVRHGEVSDEIVELAKEIQADYVVLGLPQGVEENDVFASDGINKLCKRIETEADAQVVFAERREE
jgi:nucleotide-binding universal stress UspA family protein